MGKVIANGLGAKLIGKLGFSSRKLIMANLLSLAVAGGLSQLLAIGVAPFLTRLYTSTDLGHLGLYLSFLGVAATFVTLRYELAIPAAHDERERLHLTRASYWFAIPLSVVAVGVLLGLIHFKALGYEVLETQLVALLPLAFITLVMTALVGTYRNMAIVSEEMRSLSLLLLLQAALRAVGQVLFGWMRLEFVGLALSELVARSAGGRKFWVEYRGMLGRVGVPSSAELLGTLKKFKKFPTLSLPSGLLDATAAALPVILFADIYGAEVAGYFVLIQRVLVTPASSLATALADVFQGRFASHHRNASKNMASVFLRTAILLFLFGIGPAALIFFFGERAFVFAFGEGWRAAGKMVQYIGPWILLQALVGPLSRVLLILQAQEVKLIYDVTALVTTIAVFQIAQHNHIGFVDATLWLSVVQSLSYVLYFVVILLVVLRQQAKLSASHGSHRSAS